jgi:DNA repair protein RadA/Sms
MAKTRTQYTCQACGAGAPKWAGQCADCGAWNSLVETTAPGPRAARSAGFTPATGATGVQRLDQIETTQTARTSTGMPEMDRVLGGGIVPGAVILIGGDPGIGKSTLLLQVLAQVQAQLPTLYVTGEESLTQVRLRAERLGLQRLDLPVLAETGVETVIQQLGLTRPGLVVLDPSRPCTPTRSTPHRAASRSCVNARRRSCALPRPARRR